MFQTQGTVYIITNHNDLLIIFITVTVRLVGGPNPRAGTVELFGKVNGTICDDKWDGHEAEVVCRMLGYT